MTTSLEDTRNEIVRFLRGSEPEVLCITGDWGVGKTFLWQSVLNELSKTSKALLMTRYSYVSLFGLNSLDDLKSSLFENMQWLDQDDTGFAQRGKSAAKARNRRRSTHRRCAGIGD